MWYTDSWLINITFKLSMVIHININPIHLRTSKIHLSAMFANAKYLSYAQLQSSIQFAFRWGCVSDSQWPLENGKNSGWSRESTIYSNISNTDWDNPDRNKMATMPQTTFYCICIFCTFIRYSLKYNLNGAISNQPVSVQIMACRWTGNKLLSAQRMTYFIDAYMSGLVSVSYHTFLRSHEFDDMRKMLKPHTTKQCCSQLINSSISTQINCQKTVRWELYWKKCRYHTKLGLLDRKSIFLQ